MTELQQELSQIANRPYRVTEDGLGGYVLRMEGVSGMLLCGATRQEVLEFVQSAHESLTGEIQNLSDTAFIELKEGPHE